MNIIIFGLGNPGREYEETRHNFGRMVVDKYVSENNLNWKKFNLHGEYAKQEKDRNNIYILKTTTLYMNQSGIFLKEFVDFYKFKSEDCLIIYDELSFDVGTFKLRPSGSAGGHNGMKNIIQLLNTQDIKRIRLGIGKPTFNQIDYVIGKFAPNERQTVKQVVDNIANNVLPQYIKDGSFSNLMNKFNK